MENQKTSVLSNGLLWFGAAISIAEILTGTFIAPLGFSKGLIAIILGHAIGCLFMWMAGYIGAKTGKSAMETVRLSFGSKGSLFFSVLNILQLIGWTAVMIISGARATGVILNPSLNITGEALWCILIGVLIIVWILVGLKNLGKLNMIAVGLLFVLSIVLSVVVFKGGALSSLSSDDMSFGLAVELSAAMPLSWLPLISDYTRNAKKPVFTNSISVILYFVGSCWMYILGLGATIFTGQSDISLIMLNAGLGIAGVLTIVFSTVTTTYLDAHSAAVSFNNITSKLKEKWVGVIVCVLGIILAIFTPIEQYENFLFLIGSVFAPMIAIMIADFFILKKDHASERFNITNIIIWVIGFIIYRLSMEIEIDTIVGNTLPVILITGIICLIVDGVKKLCLKKS